MRSRVPFSHCVIVIPFIDGVYPTRAEADGRLLVGFSKSGWGAFTLLLRHPDVFGRAAAFDAPLAMDWRSTGMGPRKDQLWPTREEEFTRYRMTDLVAANTPQFRSQPPRLVVLGHDLFLEDDIKFHEFLKALEMPH